jgi:hypothetical protein
VKKKGDPKKAKQRLRMGMHFRRRPKPRVNAGSKLTFANWLKMADSGGGRRE